MEYHHEETRRERSCARGMEAIGREPEPLPLLAKKMSVGWEHNLLIILAQNTNLQNVQHVPISLHINAHSHVLRIL